MQTPALHTLVWIQQSHNHLSYGRSQCYVVGCLSWAYQVMVEDELMKQANQQDMQVWREWQEQTLCPEGVQHPGISWMWHPRTAAAWGELLLLVEEGWTVDISLQGPASSLFSSEQRSCNIEKNWYNLGEILLKSHSLTNIWDGCTV